MKVLLHACCAPCSIEPVDFFESEEVELALAFINPNIHPLDEYRRRLETITTFAQERGVALIVPGYDPSVWATDAGVYGSDSTKRCRQCYAIRFRALAAHAAEYGFDTISTTLAISPYQNLNAIREELETAAFAYGLRSWFVDFRDRYPEATRRSREQGMYRQNYCGCFLSQVEAESQRAERRLARREAKSKELLGEN